MNLVTLENVSKQFSERVLLDSVNRLINEGGLVLGSVSPLRLSFIIEQHV